MKRLALSFNLVQYDLVTGVRNYSAPKFILDVVNNSTVITVIGPSTAVSSIPKTFSDTHYQVHEKYSVFYRTPFPLIND